MSNATSTGFFNLEYYVVASAFPCFLWRGSSWKFEVLNISENKYNIRYGHMYPWIFKFNRAEYGELYLY